MSWRELEAWAEKNGFEVVIRGGRCLGDPYQANLYGARYHWRLIHQSDCATKGTAKRALCRAVARILESEQ